MELRLSENFIFGENSVPKTADPQNLQPELPYARKTDPICK